MSESELLENKTLQEKLEEGGWLPFKQAYELQTIYKEEKTFFQSLSFVKSIKICPSVSKNKQTVNSACVLVATCGRLCCMLYNLIS